jgi:hypothetical protein
MRAYFLNISEEERKSIQEKQRSIYDGYQTMEPKMNKQTPLNVENLALDEKGITLNNKGHVSEYKNKGINKPMKKNCNECGGMYEEEMCEICEMKNVMNEGKTCEKCGKELAEGKICECGIVMYSDEQLEESIKIKSKKGQVIKQINESLDMFNRFRKY